MAYELVFTYTGKNNADQEKSYKKIVGTPDEEVPLEKVVSVIARQLARRDIFVRDVTVYEYTKKKVKFREVKNGLVLKDRKFLFDEMADGFAGSSADPGDYLPAPAAPVHPHEALLRRPQAIARQAPTPGLPDGPPPGTPLHPLRMEIFDPSPVQLSRLPRQYKFTPGRRYPIYREFSTGLTKETRMTQYVVKDDLGLEVTLTADHFTAAGGGLSNGFAEDPLEQAYKARLSHSGQFLEDQGQVVGKASMPAMIPAGIPVDDGSVPAELMRMPDVSAIRKQGV